MFSDNPRAEERLRTSPVIWLTTVTPGGRPQSSPVWFVAKGDEAIVYSMNSARIRNIEANPNVSLNLDGNGRGGDIVSIEGTARVDRSAPPASENTAFRAKYQQMIDQYGWTAESFAVEYPIPIRIRFRRGRAW